MALLVLWDIDGTLVRGGRAAADAYLRAITAVYRLEGELPRVSMAGKTDGQIALELLALHGLAEAGVLAQLDEFHDAYVEELTRTRERLSADLEVLPGVPALLTRLDEVGAVQTLLTGNFEATARLKLDAAGLTEHFDFSIGAFGSDHRDRERLVPVVLRKARRLRGLRRQAAAVVVIGDTPRDVACARAGGARAVAVATGTYSAAELAECAPDLLLDSLAETEAVIEQLLHL